MIDGVVVYSVADDDPLLALALARGIPAVVIDQPAGTGLPLVGIADEAAARAAADHLVALGHCRFAVVSFGLAPDGRSGPAGLARRRGTVYAVTRARLAGYAAALAAAGIDWAGVPVHESGSIRAAGHAAAERLLAADPPPTAILATSDVLAVGVLDAAAAAGVRVPRDLSVVGFDDVPAAAAAGLTTVHQDHHARAGAPASCSSPPCGASPPRRPRRCRMSSSCAAPPPRRARPPPRLRRTDVSLGG
jgi:DNA-binding LacI/PurR family transcriptional regulator